VVHTLTARLCKVKQPCLARCQYLEIQTKPYTNVSKF